MAAMPSIPATYLPAPPQERPMGAMPSIPATHLPAPP